MSLVVQFFWNTVYILLSQQILDRPTIKCHADDNFVFSKTVHRCILRSTQSNCCTAKLSTSFLLSYGPA